MAPDFFVSPPDPDAVQPEKPKQPKQPLVYTMDIEQVVEHIKWCLLFILS
jgi:hypothetical protein